MFSILDGRDSFFQWDKDRKIVVDDATIKEVHFCNKTDDCSLVVATYQEDGRTLANVPNILLQTDWRIRVYGYTGDYTKHEACYKVNKRTKPADYVYTEVELWTAEKAVEDALQAAKDSGAFKGDKGDKGEPGAINFTVVTALPTEGDTDTIYLLPTGNAENNNFNEYIYCNGAWELIGSLGAEVNLSEYVKNTDYATDKNAGVVKVANYYGLRMSSDNTIRTYFASNAEIMEKTQSYKPIVPSNLDYAVKVGITTNTQTLTEEEQQAAQTWLGLGNIEAALDNIIEIQNSLIGGVS